jgi:hypothetical protein
VALADRNLVNADRPRFIVRRGQALGVAAPANRLLHAIVKLIETSSALITPARNHRRKLELDHV